MEKIINSSSEKISKSWKFFIQKAPILTLVSIPYITFIFSCSPYIETLFNKYRILDLDFILISAFFGWVLLEIIRILRTPTLLAKLKWVEIPPWNGIDQIILKLEIDPDWLNLILGTSDLSQLRINKASINSNNYMPKWGSSPEPIDYTTMTFDPSRIPNSNITNIDEDSGDYIIIAWTKQDKIYLADPWYYAQKIVPKLETVLPANITLKLRGGEYNYNLEFNINNLTEINDQI